MKLSDVGKVKVAKRDNGSSSMVAQPICLSRSESGVQNVFLTPWNPTFDELCEKFSNPEVGDKDGPYIVRGAVNEVGTRANENIPQASLIILDGDSSLNLSTGEISEGAPAPALLHEALKDLDIQHILFTTFSHGTKGNRYRVLIPPDRPLDNSSELQSCVGSLIAKLHRAGVNLNPVKENTTWAQPWFEPRISSADAAFEFYVHKTGHPLSVDSCISWARKRVSAGVGTSVVKKSAPKTTVVDEFDSPIAKYNAEHGNPESMLKFLEAHGYVQSEQTQINGEQAYRLLAPGSSSGTAGVVLFKAKHGSWRICSHHGVGSDPLAKRGPGGKDLAHDAFDLLRILDHGGDRAKAMAAILPPKKVIQIFGGSLAKNVRQAISAIAKKIPRTIFQRGASLGRVAHLAQPVDVEGCKIPAGTAVIVELGTMDLQVILCDLATWERARSAGSNGGVIWYPVDPPSSVAKGILVAQGNWKNIPVLRAITETPILRPDGSVRDRVGYDALTGLYYEGGCPPLNLVKKPSRKEAVNAAKALIRLFREFPFVEAKTDRSVVLAYILTLILRGQIPIAPLFAVSATAPGTGKGLLIEIINLLVRGRDASIMPPVAGHGAEEETRKRITALLLQGVTSINLDNWTTAIGGEALNALLTSTEWTDRLLGQSKTVKLPNRVTWAATGNNLTVRGDMVRRTVVIRLDAGEERPELREFEVENIAQYVLEHRGELLSAAFTILCAYAVAGRPKVEGTPLGRFEVWWHAVCAPIIWIGRPDPVSSQEKLRDDDPETGKLTRFLDAWYRQFESDKVSVADLVNTVSDSGPAMLESQADLREALLECAGERGHVNPKSLGWFLRKFAGRVVSSMRLMRVGAANSRKPRYYVELMR